MEFYKLNATGNDFIIIFSNDNINLNIKQLCDRHFGIGADGLIIIDKNNNILIYNSDGSKAKMCGNGLRCVSKILYYLTNNKINEVFVDNNKIVLTQLDDDNAMLSISNPIMVKYKEGYYVNLINNHYITIANDLNTFKFTQKYIDILNDKKCNIHAIKIVDRNTIKIKTLEYGANYTLSCGSGSLAIFFAMFMLDKVDNNVSIINEGGTLYCSYDNNNYYLKGEVKLIYKGELYGF